jgi:hypothetical protein
MQSQRPTQQRLGQDNTSKVWLHHWCAYTPTGMSRAHLWWVVSCHLFNDGCMGEGGILNAHIVSLVLSMRVGSIFQRAPSSPPIKEGSPLHI